MACAVLPSPQSTFSVLRHAEVFDEIK